jgi:nucleoside-diphosphate kinase
MAKERVLVLVKPRFEHCLVEIQNAMCDAGLRLIREKALVLNARQVADFYPERVGQPIFVDMVMYLTSGVSVVLVYEGENAIATAKVIKGKCGRDGFRHRYNRSVVENVLHTPDSKEEFDRDYATVWGK